MVGQIQEFCVNARPKCKTHVFLLNRHSSVQKATTTYVQLHQPKRWLEEAEAQVSQINSKGLDLFLVECMRMIFKGWPHRKKVASPSQPSIDGKWWVKFNNFVSTRANIAKPAFCLRIHLSMQKGANTYVQLRQHKKWAGNVRIHDLICSRRGLFAKVVILAAQKIVNTWFNLGGSEIAVSPKASNS